MLALPPSDPALKENGVQVISKFTLHPDYKRVIDAAGAFFETFYRERILGIKPPGSDDSSSDDKEKEEEEKTEQFNEDEVKNFEKKRHKKNEADVLKEALETNHYAILGIEDLGMGASEGQIRSAYRKLALIHHPDKKADAAQTNPMWLKIQNAYETLTDPEKKKKYDSTLPFDETIPEGTVEESKFFETFKPVFIRNAFWSTKKPVPDIGDMDTDLKKVERFYDFWDHFDSWRDFSVFDEYNLDEAENRDERRYMEKENKKIKGEHLKKERKRIMKLVEQARENDPRIIKARREIEEQRVC